MKTNIVEAMRDLTNYLDRDDPFVVARLETIDGFLEQYDGLAEFSTMSIGPITIARYEVNTDVATKEAK